MRLISRILALVAVLVLAAGPLATPQALAGPRDAVRLTRKADPYAGAPTVLDFSRGFYKVDGKRFSSFLAINGGGPWVGPNLADPTAWVLGQGGGTATATNNPTGTLNITGDGTNGAYADLQVPTVSGRTYELRFTVSNAEISYRVGTSQSGTQLIAPTTSLANETVVRQFVATGASAWIRYSKTLAATSRITNVSVREVVSTPAPELVTNGGFDSDTGWTKGAGWTISGGVATKAAGSASSLSLSPAAQVASGRTYRVEFTVSGYGGSGVVQPNIGGVPGANRSANGTFAENITATGANNFSQFASSTFAGSIDNISVKEVVPVASVSRASEGYAERLDGTWVRFAANEPRITDRGLLVEEARTNLQANSSDLTAGTWTNVNITVTPNVAADPFGGTTADAVVEGATTTAKGVQSAGTTFTSGTTYAASFLVKSAGRRYAQITFTSSTHGATQYANFDLQAASVTASSGGTAGVYSTGNGYAWVWFAATATASASGAAQLGSIDAPNAVRAASVVGLNGTAYYVAHGQVEAGSFATSPIITAGAAATKALDNDALGVTNPTEWTLFGELEITKETGTNRRIVDWSDGTDANKVLVEVLSNGTVQARVINASVNTSIGTEAAPGSGVRRVKWMLRRSGGNLTLVVNGVIVSTAAASMPAVSSLQIGAYRAAGGGWLNDRVQRLALWPRALTDEELKGFTSPAVPLASNDNGTVHPALALWEAA